MLNGLDLFTGIGGLTLALKEWVRPTAYCEIDPYCQSVLLSRMQEGHLPKAPIWDDIRSLKRDNIFIPVDIISGGFPCQDISIAGHGKGLEGERSGLFFEIMRLAKEIKPKFIFLENVPAITSRGGLRVVREIASLGYDCRWCVISAASVGAIHERKRWFLLAHDNCFRRKRLQKIFKKRRKVVNFKQFNCSIDRFLFQHEKIKEDDTESKLPSYLCREDDGVQNRMDRIKALGNAVVPQQAKKAFEILLGIDV